MSGEAALAAIWERTGANLPVDSDRRRHGGMPVFNGSRVPARFLLDLLKQGENIEEFLSRYTSVEREYAVRCLISRVTWSRRLPIVMQTGFHLMMGLGTSQAKSIRRDKCRL